MKILITGSRGFIASNLAKKLKELGHSVIDFDLPEKSVLKGEDLEPAVIQADVVYHIAAQADLTQMTTLEGAKAGVSLNVHGTHLVAYLCAKHHKWLIYASTVCVYGNQDVHPETEDTTLPNPSELYACSKYAGEWIVKGYGHNFQMPWTILRFATIYGEGMRKAMGMDIFFRQAFAGEPITVHGDGQQDRTLTYINDLVEGIVAPLSHHKAAEGQIFNLTSTQSISALKMAEDIKELTGTDSPVVHIAQRANQTFHEDFEVSKAKNMLGWTAETPWKEGLAKTYEWIKTKK